MEQKYAEYAAQKAVELLAIDSPTGFTDRAAAWVRDAFGALGFAAKKTAKGGVLIDLGGAESEEGALLLQAHTDTLGAMVAEVKANGRLRVTNLGGMRAENGETENVRVYTRGGKVYEGTLQLCNASVHVNGDYGKTERTFDTTEVLLDEAVTSADETRALGIETGDIVCFDPRTRVTASGYIKSRFLDDKLSVGILLGFAKYLRDENKQLPRRTYVHVTVYEEVGHGGAGSVPAGVTESISVDMGCVGDGLRCTERQVSICAKDSGGPYSYEVVGKLIDAAKREGADYAVDVYPHYGSDVEATLSAGYIDGYPRLNSHGAVEIRGRRAPVAGLVCMDQMMVDVTGIPDVCEGDEVILLGGTIGVDEYADTAQLNRNESLARTGRRVPRVYLENGRVV